MTNVLVEDIYNVIAIISACNGIEHRTLSFYVYFVCVIKNIAKTCH